MKNLIIFIVLSFIFCVRIFAQDNTPCPTISISGPPDLIKPNESSIFTAEIKGIDLSKISYLWSISNGTIVEGQKTKVLRFLPINLKETVKATVEITGFPDNCTKTVAATMTQIVCPMSVSIKIGEISHQPSKISKEVIDGLVVALNNDSTAVAYIIQQFARNITQIQVEKRLENIFGMINSRKIPTERIKLFIYRDNKKLTEVWVVPQNTDKPLMRKDAVQTSAISYKQDLAKLFAHKNKKN